MGALPLAGTGMCVLPLRGCGASMVAAMAWDLALAAGSAGLLVATGIAKLRRPAPTAAALAASGLAGRGATRLPRRRARLLGAGEVAVGAVALATGARAAFAAVTVVYLAFLVFAGYALARGRGRISCGCAGREDTPVGPAHLVICAAGAAGAAAALATGAAPLTSWSVAGSGCLVAAAGWLLLTDWPRWTAARARLRPLPAAGPGPVAGA